MISLYNLGINGILADEMGLGKTIQIISLLAFLKESKNIHGKFLIIAPNATIGNWVREINKWFPACRAVKLKATKEEREETLRKYIRKR